MPERLKGRSPPRHGDFTVGPPFCAGYDRLRPLSRTQEPGLVLEVRLPFLDIHLAEWRPQIVCRRLMYEGAFFKQLGSFLMDQTRYLQDLRLNVTSENLWDALDQGTFSVVASRAKFQHEALENT